MPQVPLSPTAELFICYASHDVDRVAAIAGDLESAGVTVWRDKDKILGGGNYGPEIVRAVRNCKAFVLMCSEASMRSRNVKQEIQLAWKYGKPYLPLLLDNSISSGFPEQVEYWLEGHQWIEVFDRPADEWLPHVMNSLTTVGVQTAQCSGMDSGYMSAAATRPFEKGLTGLWRLAAYSDLIWPEPANWLNRGHARTTLRDMGESPENVKHVFCLRDRVCLAIESEREGHLLLLNKGTSGNIYCLCPSRFAPDTRLKIGCSYLPQAEPPLDAFVLTGRVGREHLLAIVTEEPLGLEWMPTSSSSPARVLAPIEIDALAERLQSLEPDRWAAMSTYFDISP